MRYQGTIREWVLDRYNAGLTPDQIFNESQAVDSTHKAYGLSWNYLKFIIRQHQKEASCNAKKSTATTATTTPPNFVKLATDEPSTVTTRRIFGDGPSLVDSSD